MKFWKKILAVTAVLSLAVSAVPASAATDVIDFEDGKIPVGIVHADDGDQGKFSVAEYEGSKRLMYVPNGDAMPKVVFKPVDLYGADYTNVWGIQFDLALYLEGETLDWNGGTVGATPTGPSEWANGTEWLIEDYEDGISDIKTVKNFLKEDFKFTGKETKEPLFMFMDWGNKQKATIYIDNVQLLDKDGNPLPLNLTYEAAAPKTGTQSYAIYFAIGAVVMAAGAVVLKKRRSAEA